MYKKIFILSELSLLLLLYSCNRNNDNQPADTYLIDYQTKSSISASAIKVFLVSYGMSDLDSLAKYDVKIYKVTYHTSYLGKDITASGVIAIPAQVTDNLPVLGAYRGTIFSQDEAPSNQAFLSGYEIFSTLGFVTIIPDMIGFGSSDQYIHPYYNYELTSGCAVDMIKAGQEFMKKLNITSNGKLFLYGYSEGGYITTATHKAIESSPIPGLTLTAVASGAGSYNPAAVMQDIVSRVAFTSPSYLAFIVYSYKDVYGWTEPLATFFNPPYADLIPGLLDGTHNQSEINSQLNDTLDVLFKVSYLDQIRNGTETLLTHALTENRVDNWAPKVPTRIYHSSNDQYIPISNSENTVKTMKSLGGNAEFVQIPGNSHEDAGIQMIRYAVPWLDSLAEF